MLEVNRESVKAWMLKAGRSRVWLAAQLSISPRTVGNLLNRSDRDIPKHHIPRIRELMKFDLEERQNIVLETGSERFMKIEERARLKGFTIYEYLNNLIDLDLG